MSRPILAVLTVGLMLILAIGASALGLFGGVDVCGADRTPGCVSWPAPIGLSLWALFMAFVIALVVWQVRYLDR